MRIANTRAVNAHAVSISKIFDILHILFRAYLVCAHIMRKDVPGFA